MSCLREQKATLTAFSSPSKWHLRCPKWRPSTTFIYQIYPQLVRKKPQDQFWATAVKPRIYGLAFTMRKWFLSDPSPIIGYACHSLTDSLTDSCLVNLIDVTLACEDDNSNLLRLLLLLMLMMRIVLTTVWCRFGRWSLVIKLSFCSDFEHKVSRFGQDFEVDVQARFWS